VPSKCIQILNYLGIPDLQSQVRQGEAVPGDDVMSLHNYVGILNAA